MAFVFRCCIVPVLLLHLKIIYLGCTWSVGLTIHLVWNTVSTAHGSSNHQGIILRLNPFNQASDIFLTYKRLGDDFIPLHFLYR
jgi:hypothetical protein